MNMLGFGDNHDLTEYLRLYIAIHCDHEGGNASAHTSRTSALCAGRPFAHRFCRPRRFHPLGSLPLLRRCVVCTRRPPPWVCDAFQSSYHVLCQAFDTVHSLANQEVLRWQMNMQKELGNEITHENIKDYLWKTLKSGQVVPG